MNVIFRRFRLLVLVRALLFGATTALFFILLFRFSVPATTVIVGLLGVYQLFALVRFVEKTNWDVARFLQSIRYADFTQTFTGGRRGPSFDALNDAFGEVISEFQRVRAEKEEHYRYLQTVVQHVGIGLICYEEGGEVQLLNTAAKRMLRLQRLKTVHELASFSPELVRTLLTLQPGEKALVRLRDQEDELQLAVYATHFRLRERNYRLVSIQDIKTELEAQEIESWQKLTRVLTHEIMNSITPIASLASTVNDLLEHDSGDGAAQVGEETISDIRDALQTIEKRSHGLLHFVDAYRSFTRIPKPNFELFSIAALFARVERLMRTQVQSRSIRLSISVEPERLELTADPELIEQVLINLLINAIQALAGRPDAEIRLQAWMDERSRITIQVSDNGPGIIPEALEKIFVPFFTTKQEGSGIGLSLSRQIMRLHRGTISVFSEPEVRTVFTLRF